MKKIAHSEDSEGQHWICSVAVKACIIPVMSFRAGEVAGMGYWAQTREPEIGDWTPDSSHYTTVSVSVLMKVIGLGIS